MSRVFAENTANYLLAQSSNLAAEQEEFTYFAWIKHLSTSIDTSYWVGTGQNGSGPNRIMLGADKTIQAAIFSSNNEGSFTEESPASSLPFSTWSAAVIRRKSDGAGGYLREIIIDGVVEFSAASTAGAGWKTGSHDIVVGRNVSGATLPANGKIAHIAIWAASKSDADITSLAGGTNPKDIDATGRYAYYPLTTASLANEWAADSQALTTDGSSVADFAVNGTVANDDADNPSVSASVVPASLTVTQTELTPGGTISGSYSNYDTVPTTLTATEKSGTNNITITSPTISDNGDGTGTFSGTMPSLPVTGTAGLLRFGDVDVELS